MKDINDNNFTYGEIDCETLLQCFIFIQNQYDGLTERSSNFIDFGHGSGKALLAACLSGKFEKCIGVELL